jgi:hypothetical protein
MIIFGVHMFKLNNRYNIVKSSHHYEVSMHLGNLALGIYLAFIINVTNMSVYPEVSGLAVWSENCKWYSSLPLGAVVLLFCESV